MGNVAVTAASASATASKRFSPFELTPDGRRVKRAVLTLSSSYATGGDTLAPADLGLSRVYDLLIEANDADLAAGQKNPFTLSLAGTASAPKIKCYDAADTEEGATSDRSGTSIIAWVIGV